METIVTLNCNGLKANFAYVKQLIRNYKCIYLTETWTQKSESHIFSEFEKEFFIVPVFARRHNSGRPFGGTAFLLKRNSFSHSDVIIQEDRVTVIRTTLHNTNIILTGVYLPPSGSDNYIENYRTHLATIQGIHRQFSTTCESIIIGDFQCCPTVV